MGRTAQGVIGIKMREGDQVAGAEVVTEGDDLLIITTSGIGKRTALDQYPRKGRGTMGVRTIDVHAMDIIGKIAAARVVSPEDDLSIISANGQMLRTQIGSIRPMGRSTRGVKLIELDEGDFVASIAIFSPKDLAKVDPEIENS